MRMIRNFFKGRRPPEQVTVIPPEVPPGIVAWAVGDIHGRLDLLLPILDLIRRDRDTDHGRRYITVFLGDYVDRGPNSREVLDSLCDFAADPAIDCVFLRGNHEDKMEQFLDQPEIGPEWCEYGGREALASFGLSPPAMAHRRDAWRQVSEDLAFRLTSRQRSFFENLKFSYSLGGYFFCHAGARPGTPLAQQDAHDLLWIRNSFLDHPDRFEQIVVHGHTITADVALDHRRIGLDTGAYKSGILSALRLEGSAQEIVQAVVRRRGDAAQTRRRLVSGVTATPA